MDELLDEKKKDRMDVPEQLRMGSTLGRLIRKLASRSGRSYQQMLLVIATRGIEPYCRESGNDLAVLLQECASDFVRPGPMRSEGVRKKSEDPAA